MTVPFRPSVLPVPEPQTPFLDTITRAFLQTRNLVEADRASAQANQLFEDQRRQNKLRSESLADELSTRRQDRAIQIAEDPRIIQTPGAPAAPSRVAAPAQPPIPAQPGIPPAPGEETIGGRIADELAPPPGGGIPPQVAPGATRGPGVTDIGGGLSFDPQGPERAQEAASARLAEMLEQFAAGQEDPATADALRQAIPEMSAAIQTGQNPMQIVQAARGAVEQVQFGLRALPEEDRIRLVESGLHRLPLEAQLQAVQDVPTARQVAAQIARASVAEQIDLREHQQAIELRQTPTGAQIAAGVEKPLGERANTKSLMTRIRQLIRANTEEARSVDLLTTGLPDMLASGEVIRQGADFIRVNVDEDKIRRDAQLQALEEGALMFTDEELAEVRARIDELTDEAIAGGGDEGVARPTPEARASELLADGASAEEIKSILRHEGYKIQ